MSTDRENGTINTVKKMCSVDGCDRSVEGGRRSGICVGHRNRLQRYGNFGVAPIKIVPPRGISGWGVVEFNGWDVKEFGCWEYRGPKFANGYGQVKIDGKPKLLHRISYEHFVGNIPRGLIVRHKCDNPPCLNPDHLETGTVAQNNADRNNRGRTATGIRGSGKVADVDVLRIREELSECVDRIERGKRYVEFADEYNVSYSTIQKIWLNTTYRHVVSGGVIYE